MDVIRRQQELNDLCRRNTQQAQERQRKRFDKKVESCFNLPNEYSSSIILTDSDFIFTNRTCAIAITADMSFKTALAADFKREYKT